MEVEAEVVRLGRDPASDLVLNDPKCSRRHAVIERTPDGISVRDNGSANGVIVNGHKVERARIRDGDLIKLGDVLVTLLPEPAAGTLVMGGAEALEPEDEDGDEPEEDGTIPEVPAEYFGAGRARPTDRTIPPGPPVPPPWRRQGATPDRDPAGAALAELPLDEGAGTFRGRAAGRPLTVTVLAVLWAVCVPAYALGGIAASRAAAGGTRASLLAAGLALAVLSGAMAFGLWREQGWARVGQLVLAGLGLFFCPFSLASIAVLVYMLRPDVAWRFSDRSGALPEEAGRAEAAFTAALLAAAALGALLTVGLSALLRTGAPAGTASGRLRARGSAAERAVVADLQALAAAQDAFRSVCNTGYGDLEALRRPATVIPDYPADGPPFLRGEAFDQAERNGYRFALTVEEEMPPAPGCPSRRFRRFLYAAAPAGPGRFLVIGPDAVVRAAEGRAATLEDPPAP